MANSLEPQKRATPALPMMTKRQKAILNLVCEGFTSSQIADALMIAQKTVEFHRARLLSLFGATNTVLLVRAAMRQGFIQP